MENIIETSSISLDYNKSREDRDLGAYRVCLYDRYGHYDDYFYLTGEQLKDLVDGLKDYKIEVKKEFL